MTNDGRPPSSNAITGPRISRNNLKSVKSINLLTY